MKTLGRQRLSKNEGLCDCGKGTKRVSRGLCRSCYDKVIYNENRRASRLKGFVKHPIGTIRTDKSGYQRIKIDEGHGAKDWVKYHKFLMEKKLDRKLQPYESVHHKNGKKDDNRISNLELWVSKQPKGQKPKDLINYARWILKTYANE